MLIEQARAGKKIAIPRWLWIAGGFLLAAGAAGIVVLATHWPFTRDAMTRALESASGREVEIGTFSNSYFPPGCTAGGIRFLRHKHPDLQPIITVEKLEVRGSLIGMFTSPKRLTEVRVVGMHMIVPPPTPDGEKTSVLLNSGPGGKSLAISKVVADGALLEFVPEDRGKRYILKIDKLGLSNLGPGTSMSYRATLTNTEPPGVIRAEGKFGPWNPENIGETPVSGKYTYDDIDLSHFKSIAGKGSARGEFSGQLGQIQTHGSVDVAGFQVDGSDHAIPLATTFDATVNGTNGDVVLHPAVARFRHTQINVSGPIAAVAGEKGKTARFEIAVPQGRVDDLLYLFTKGAPGMSGDVSLTGKFAWPPGPEKFLEKIRLDLTFGMSASRFTSPNTQQSINRISESAQGEKKQQEESDPRTVLSEVRGQIQVRQGVASIANGSFQVTGADAAVNGTYNLLDHKVELHGTLDTKGNLSDTTSGFKSLVLKAVTPLFRKRGPVRIIPFEITGYYGNTSVGIDWKRDLSHSAK